MQHVLPQMQENEGDEIQICMQSICIVSWKDADFSCRFCLHFASVTPTQINTVQFVCGHLEGEQE